MRYRDEHADEDAGNGAAEPLPLDPAHQQEADEDLPQQIEGGAGGGDGHLRVGGNLGRMCDHELVTDGREQHSGDEYDMEVHVGVTSELNRVARQL